MDLILSSSIFFFRKARAKALEGGEGY